MIDNFHHTALMHACTLVRLSVSEVIEQHAHMTKVTTRRELAIPASGGASGVNAATIDDQHRFPVAGDTSRAYHDWRHVARVWSYLAPRTRAVTISCEREASAAFALMHDWWFIAYPDYPGQNEALSRDELTSRAEALGLRAQAAILAALGIDASARHTQTQRGLHPAVERMLDADLAGLADPWDDYQQSAWAVRRELDLKENSNKWVVGRTSFLEAMLTRPRIYYTDEALGALEELARANMQRELKQLTEEKA